MKNDEAIKKAIEMKKQGASVGDTARELMRQGIPMAEAAKIVTGLSAPMTASQRHKARRDHDEGISTGWARY